MSLGKVHFLLDTPDVCRRLQQACVSKEVSTDKISDLAQVQHAQSKAAGQTPENTDCASVAEEGKFCRKNRISQNYIFLLG